MPDPATISAAPAPTTDGAAIASRVLEAVFRAREGFSRVVTPVLRAEFDLDQREYVILRWIGEGSLTPGSLAGTLHLPGYAASRLLDPFIRRGLVGRVADERDGRRYHLHLTDAGRDLVRGVELRIAGLLGERLSALSPAQAENLLGSLELLTRLDEPPGEGP